MDDTLNSADAGLGVTDVLPLGETPPAGRGDDDYSRSFHRVRSRLVNRAGLSYVEFVRNLQPNYARVKFDVALGYAMLVVSVVPCVVLSHLAFSPFVVAPLGAVLIGYWMAYLQLFLHEGAHYNLAPSRAGSDLLCDMLIGWIIGTSVDKYRKVHFHHHRAIGMADDSEFTYFFPLNAAFLLKSLFGIRALEVIASRGRVIQKKDNVSSAPSWLDAQLSIDERQSAGSRVLIGGMLVHAAFVGLAVYLGYYSVAAAWVLGVGMVFPFFGAVRQLLEHRDDKATADIDYSRTAHGAFTRMFGSGPFSSTFGGAGFNRHLLHHWEPNVSYTNLPQLEEFLAGTEMRSIMDRRRATYSGVFLRLLSLR